MMESLPHWHPIFVHFTVALLFVAAPFFFVATNAQAYAVRYQTRIVARWLWWTGGAFTVLTAVAGIVAFYLAEPDEIALGEMEMHRNLAIITFLGVVASTVWSLSSYRKQEEEKKSFLWLMSITLLLLAVTAWKGGELVFRHGIGVQNFSATAIPLNSSNELGGSSSSATSLPAGNADSTTLMPISGDRESNPNTETMPKGVEVPRVKESASSVEKSKIADAAKNVDLSSTTVGKSPETDTSVKKSVESGTPVSESTSLP